MPSCVHLPAENLEYIFHFLDGKSFCKVREVCKTWCQIIKEMQKKKKIWKKFCYQEIPSYIMEDILSFKSVPKNDPCLNFNELYKRWFKTRMVVGAPYLLKNISPPSRPQPSITCLKLSGSFIISGHSSGHICIWNLNTGEIVQRCLIHLKTIVDIALLDLVNLGSYYGMEDLPWGHHHAITISKDSYIKVISLLETVNSSNVTHLNHHSTDLTGIRLFGSRFAVSCLDNIISVWDINVLKTPHFHLNTTFSHRIIGPADILYNFRLWHDQIQCITRTCKLKVFEKSTDEWVDKQCLKKFYSEESGEKLITVIRSFLFRDEIVILFTSDGRMVISVGDKFNNQFYLMRTLQTLITSVVLKATILVLGGENGRIYVFHIPETKHLLQLDLSNPSFIKTLSEASITSLDIACELESPVIVAGTNESIFTVKWFPTISSHQKLTERTLF